MFYWAYNETRIYLGAPMLMLKKALYIANTAVFITIAATAACGLITLGHEMVKAAIDYIPENED